MPCLRHKSATFIPASASFKTPIICSSVNLDFFMTSSPSAQSLTLHWDTWAGEGHMRPYLVHKLFYDVVETDTSSARLDRCMLVTIGVKASPRLPHFTLFQCGAHA